MRREYGQPGTSGLASRYIGALYWAFATLCTVGYGDISAKTEGERVFAIISMITGGFVFSGVIAKIGSLVAKLDAAKTAHNDKMDAVRHTEWLPNASGFILHVFLRSLVVSA